MTLEELKQFDGREGRRAYIAVKGVVYDVTDNGLWGEGVHMHTHQAGADLTEAISSAPHPETHLQKLPVVGNIEGSPSTDNTSVDTVAKNSRSLAQRIYAKFHPHPVLVHLPMGLLPFSLLMQVLFLYSGDFYCVIAGYYALLASMFGVLVACCSGITSWHINYAHTFSPIFKKKLVLSVLLLILTLTVAGLASFDAIYTLLLSLCVVIAYIIGFFGGKLTGF
ncbi:DUF2231 domain-containing protein [Deferribacterales bacterium RsTz2092]